MTLRILHVVSEQTTEDSLAQLSCLLAGLPPDRFSQRIEVAGKLRMSLSLRASTHRMRPLGLSLPFAFGSPELGRLLKSHPADVAVAWDTEVIPAVAQSRGPNWLMAVSEPQMVPCASRWYWRAADSCGQTRAICSSETIRHRLRTAGLPEASLALLRPAVDFGAFRRVDRVRIREELGLPADSRVMLAGSRPSDVGGQYVAAWATAILYQIWPDVRMILPGGFREDRRARRLTEECYCPEIFRVASDKYGPADLLATSDMLVFPACEDQPAEWLAWAMAASVPIVATRTPAVTELISDGQTGFLVDSPRPHTLATAIQLAWENGEARRRCTQEAGHRAFELFRAQKCVDDFRRLLESPAGPTDSVAARPRGIGCSSALPCGVDVIQ